MANPTSGFKDQGHSALEKTKEVAGHMGDKAKEVVGQMGDKAKEAGSKLGDMASTTASKVSDMASSAASTAGKTAEKWTSAAGSSVKHLGETIKEKGPHEGMLGDATRAVADTIQQGGRYIEQEGLSGMADDVTELIRRNPLPAVLVGIGIGFLLGRTLGGS